MSFIYIVIIIYIDLYRYIDLVIVYVLRLSRKRISMAKWRRHLGHASLAAASAKLLPWPGGRDV